MLTSVSVAIKSETHLVFENNTGLTTVKDFSQVFKTCRKAMFDLNSEKW